MKAPQYATTSLMSPSGVPEAKDGDGHMYTGMKRRAVFSVYVIIVAGGMAACSMQPSDESLTQSVQAKFQAEPQLQTAAIQVAVSKGEATLSGEVSDDAVRRKAVALASVTEGIKKVTDAMQVMVTIPAGSEVQVTMSDSIHSKTSRVGSLFRSTLHVAITSGDQVIIPAGTDVYVKLIHAKSAGSIKGSSELEVILDHLVLEGESIPLSSSVVREKGASRGKQTAKRSAIAGGAGAILGGIIGGGRGAAIGAGVGAGGTLAYQALTKGPEIRIPAQARLDFTLAESFKVPQPAKTH